MAFIVVARALRLSADCSFPGFGFGFGYGFGLVWFGSTVDGSAFGFCHGSAAVLDSFQLPTAPAIMELHLATIKQLK